VNTLTLIFLYLRDLRIFNLFPGKWSNKDHLNHLMVKIPSQKEIKDFWIHLSNSAKYSENVLQQINQVKIKAMRNKAVFSENDFNALINFLDDELAFALLINQNSKCDPFKFIKF